MKFRQFLLNEDAPIAGGPPPGGPASPPPMGGMGGPPMGDPMGGMGGPPMGGGPMGPGAGAPMPPPVIPKHADVWDILDSLLNHKPLEHEKQAAQQKNNPPAPPMGPAMGPQGPALMS